MQTLKDHFNSKAQRRGPIDFVTYWSLILTLLELCRELQCPMPTDLPPPPRPG